jgi:hypothetical protein
MAVLLFPEFRTSGSKSLHGLGATVVGADCPDPVHAAPTLADGFALSRSTSSPLETSGSLVLPSPLMSPPVRPFQLAPLVWGQVASFWFWSSWESWRTNFRPT